jgi:hypothetical protein
MEAEKKESEPGLPSEPNGAQPSTVHLPIEDEAPRGNVHSEEDEDVALGEVPPPHKG